MNKQTLKQIWIVLALAGVMLLVFCFRIFTPKEPAQDDVTHPVSLQDPSEGTGLRLQPVYGELTIYYYDDTGEPGQYCIDSSQYSAENPPTLLQLCQEAENGLGLPYQQMALSAEVGENLGPIVVALPDDYQEILDQHAIHLEVYQNTLATTIRANHLDAYDIVFEAPGLPDTHYLPAALTISPDSYDGRFEVLHEEELFPVSLPWTEPYAFYQNYGLAETDTKADLLARFLQVSGTPGGGYTNEMLDEEWMLLQVFSHGAALGLYEYYYGDVYAVEEQPGFLSKRLLFLAGGEAVYMDPARVEMAVKLVYGRDIDIAAMDKTDPSSIWMTWQYHQQAGVISTAEWGGGYGYDWQPLPIVLSYEDLGDSYRAEVVFYPDRMHGLTDEEFAAVLEQERQRLATEPKMEIFIAKGEQSQLTFLSSDYI